MVIKALKESIFVVTLTAQNAERLPNWMFIDSFSRNIVEINIQFRIEVVST